jgi:hypothetical protein
MTMPPFLGVPAVFGTDLVRDLGVDFGASAALGQGGPEKATAATPKLFETICQQFGKIFPRLSNRSRIDLVGKKHSVRDMDVTEVGTIISFKMLT